MVRVMVCVTRQVTCRRLIATGADFVQGRGNLSVVHVAHTGSNYLDNPREGEALEYLFEAARKHGADLTVLRADDAIKTLTSFARRERITHIILGIGVAKSDDFFRQLKANLPFVEIIQVPEVESQKELMV